MMYKTELEKEITEKYLASIKGKMLREFDFSDIESFAMELHEAGREAVEKGATVAKDHFGVKTTPFLSWDEITENAKEGRRIQARYLLNKYNISLKEEA